MKHLPLYNNHFNTLYNEFKQFILTKGYSGGINATYPACIREFLFFIEQEGLISIEQVQASVVSEYNDHLMQRPNQRREGGLSDSTIRNHLFSLRLFFDYLMDTEQITVSPMHLPKFQISQYKQRNILSIEEIKQLYAVCETGKDKALLSIAYGCGLRRSEIKNLDTNDVLLHKGILIVRNGKFGKSRTIPLSDKVIVNLKEYLVYERMNYVRELSGSIISNAFFISPQGNRINGQRLNERLKELILKTNDQKMIGKEITLHCLRHSIATHLIDNGASIEFVQGLLGHAEIDTAHLYSKRRKQQLKIRTQFN